MTEKKRLILSISNLEEDKKTTKNLYSELSTQIGNIKSTVDEYEKYLNDNDIKGKFIAELKVIDSFIPEVKAATANLIAVIDTEIKSHNAELVTIKTNLVPLLTKVKLQSELQEKNDAIKKEQQKLNGISIKKNNLKTKKAFYKKQSEMILDYYKQIIAKYESLRNEFKKFESKFGDITLSVFVGFNDDTFNLNVVKDYLNKNDLKRVSKYTSGDIQSEYDK